MHRHALAVPLLAVAVWSVGVGVTRGAPGTEPLPAFHEIEEVSARKQQFFEYLTPVIRAENERIQEQRAELEAMVARHRTGRQLGWLERRILEELAAEYRVTTEEGALGSVLDTLLRRVDVIPRSLVLVQAAKESGWGSSRFARLANNLFGEWCFESGCGIVPRNRPDGRRHEVRSFDSVRDSVASYINNLNTHDSYRKLREMRAELRQRNQPLSGALLAIGLESYSARGETYVREVQSMIRQNGLDSAAGTSTSTGGG